MGLERPDSNPGSAYGVNLGELFNLSEPELLLW